MSDKIEVIENLGKVVDRLLIGGAMAYTFLKAQGLPIGKSLVEDDKLDLAKKLLTDLGGEADAAGGPRGGLRDRGRRAQRNGGDDSGRQDRRGYRARRRSSSTPG